MAANAKVNNSQVSQDQNISVDNIFFFSKLAKLKLLFLYKLHNNNCRRMWIMFAMFCRLFNCHWHVHHSVLHNPIQPRGGGECILPHSQVHFLKYLKNCFSYGLETFWKFKWTNFQSKIFQPPPPTLGYHSNVQSWRTFLKTHFGNFHAKAHQNSTLVCYFHEECPKCSLLWKFGLLIPPDGALATTFVSHSPSCFNDLKLGSTITMAPRIVSFASIVYKLLQKVTFVDFQQGERGFDFWIGIPSEKSENHGANQRRESAETTVLSECL